MACAKYWCTTSFAGATQQESSLEQVEWVEVGGKVVVGVKVVAEWKVVMELTAEETLTAGWCCCHPDLSHGSNLGLSYRPGKVFGLQ